MTPKENAEHLCCLFHGVNISREECKQQAIFCVDEIIKTITSKDIFPYIQSVNIKHSLEILKYWNDVKTEINLL